MVQKRDIKDNSVPLKYFPQSGNTNSTENNLGTREIKPLLPFVISGGTNTEYYYFKHITNHTKYKFTTKPEYFGNESAYTEIFPRLIRKILQNNKDAHIFCVFDWDTIHDNQTKLNKHNAFVKEFEQEINSGAVVICPSMPCIEYWFLLHFVDYSDFLKNYSKVAQKLASYIKPCFDNPSVSLKKLLKSAEYLQNPDWVIKLSNELGSLDNAILRAENNIKHFVATGDLEKHSYSYVYQLFQFISSNNIENVGDTDN